MLERKRGRGRQAPHTQRRSYPNQIPLSAAEIQRVCAPLEKVSFSKALGAFEGFDIWGHAKEKVLQSRDLFCRRLTAP